MDDAELIEAYFQHYGKGADQPDRSVEHVTEGGLPYDILRNVRGTLAVMGVVGWVPEGEWPAAARDD